MNINFVKSTMFKSKITKAAEEGIIKASDDWMKFAKEGGHLEPEKVLEVIPIAIEVEEKVPQIVE